MAFMNESVDDMSRQLSKALTVSYSLRSVAAIFGTVTNGVIVYCVCKSKVLHTKFMINLTVCAIADILYCLSHLPICIQGLYHSYWNTSMATTPLQCMMYLWFFLYLLNFAHFATLVLALDRLLAVAVPLWYVAVNTTKYICLTNVLGHIFSIAWPLIELSQVKDFPRIPVCSLAFATSAKYRQIYVSFTALNATIILALCSVTVLCLFLRLRISRVCGHCVTTARRALEVKMIKTALAHCCLYAVSWFVLVIGGQAYKMESPANFTAYASYFLFASMLGPSTTLFAYLIFLKKFRSELCTLCCGRNVA